MKIICFGDGAIQKNQKERHNRDDYSQTLDCTTTEVTEESIMENSGEFFKTAGPALQRDNEECDRVQMENTPFWETEVDFDNDESEVGDATARRNRRNRNNNSPAAATNPVHTVNWRARDRRERNEKRVIIPPENEYHSPMRAADMFKLIEPKVGMVAKEKGTLVKTHTNVNNEAECWAKCDAKHDCLSLEYCIKSKTCKLYNLKYTEDTEVVYSAEDEGTCSAYYMKEKSVLGCYKSGVICTGTQIGSRINSMDMDGQDPDDYCVDLCKATENCNCMSVQRETAKRGRKTQSFRFCKLYTGTSYTQGRELDSAVTMPDYDQCSAYMCTNGKVDWGYSGHYNMLLFGAQWDTTEEPVEKYLKCSTCDKSWYPGVEMGGAVFLMGMTVDLFLGYTTTEDGVTAQFHGIGMGFETELIGACGFIQAIVYNQRFDNFKGKGQAFCVGADTWLEEVGADVCFGFTRDGDTEFAFPTLFNLDDDGHVPNRPWEQTFNSLGFQMSIGVGVSPIAIAWVNHEVGIGNAQCTRQSD